MSQPDTHQAEALVSADEVSRVTGIPRQTLYDMVKTNRIPFEEVTQPWHTRRQYRFRLSQVREMVERMREAHAARMASRAS